MSKRAKQRNNMILLYAGQAIIIFLLVFPLVYAVGGSFKSTEEFLLGGMKIFPDVWHPENYMKAWKQANFARYTFNSVFFAVTSVLGVIVTTSMTGYTMSRSNFPGKTLLTGTFGFMMFLIGAVTLFPIRDRAGVTGFYLGYGYYSDCDGTTLLLYSGNGLL